jgi:RNA polymerase sigma factor (sigma-70 family)
MRSQRTITLDGQAIPAFQSFLEDHRTVVYRFLLASVGPAEADDCFQETFLAALRAYPRLRDGNNLRSWVLTIATRKAIDAGRARARRPVAVAGAGSDSGGRAGLDISGPAGDERLAPDADEPLWRAVRGLPPKQRAAVVHRFVLDRAYRDVALVMGTTEEAARANVAQGLKRLRRELDDADE